ncbi:MAG: hypothetical protein CDV28_102219 [Candidatus Electronema aureum]|uniref:DUF8201 domain-containing protein n=1 Tax=Candidatus Electronema aureum TaxID=2005002 RepID=A0A521G5B9_9BACT|nr:MAG: hypothetical protein CDV28_102219 [Candidatus Electronema aureum]
MNIFIFSIFVSLVLYLTLTISFAGYGKAIYLIINDRYKKEVNHQISFLVWTGFCCFIFIMSIIHLFFSLDLYVVVPTLTFGIILSIIFFIKNFNYYLQIVLSVPTWLLVVMFFALSLVSTWLALRAMLPPTNYDSGLYHFNSIKWLNSFPITYGIGNLHGRLSFNQSFFAYAASLNFYPLFNHGRSIANSFLILLSFATLVEFSFRLRSKDKFKNLNFVLSIFTIPVLAYWSLTSDGMQSPSPDLTSNLIQIIIFFYFVEFLNTEKNSTKSIYLLSLLTATAITIKLSNLLFCMSIIFLLFFISSLRKNFSVKGYLLSTFIIFAILAVWCIRGFIMSGAPLYPSTIGYINAEWSVPVDEINEMEKWVYSWARQPKMHWSVVLGNWNWFTPWINVITTKRNIEVVFPSFVFLSLTIINIVLYFRSKNIFRLYFLSKLTIIIPPAIGLLFWFFTAPDPRFAQGLFFLLPISSALFMLYLTRELLKRTTYIITICILFLFCSFNLIRFMVNNMSTFRQISMIGWQNIKNVEIERKITKHGVVIFKPLHGDQCWDSPIPCTPYFNEELRMRNHKVVSSGFSIK